MPFIGLLCHHVDYHLMVEHSPLTRMKSLTLRSNFLKITLFILALFVLDALPLLANAHKQLLTKQFFSFKITLKLLLLTNEMKALFALV